ncbi:putative transcription factor C2H2 family [Rosa chinensis]|uniref:Putative transcription factor C2H2 family n=1 Tax=Rosa chinensis TaxID=74649 RepID=A0A2P6S6I4_ROSCH|nr:zinc finger protein 511 [Rosa chinensis]PRQ54278.1 putative transcription factor C2H2 family [Rosa chinensis]
MAMELELGFPYWKALRRKFGPESPFFASGNLERELLVKQLALDLTEDEKRELRNFVDEEGRGVFCPIVGCGAKLTCLEDFEDHYNARHTASCSVCSRVYPTSRLLSIHVSEAHSSFFQAKVARGDPMYECLVEGCDLKLKTYKSRQQHLVDKHKFPTSFEFFKKAPPSKKQRQKKQRKQAYVKRADASDMEVENEVIDDIDHSRKQKKKNQQKQANLKKPDVSNMDVGNEDINNLVTAVSKLSTSDSSPSSISFGRRPTRGLTFVPRAVQREKKPDST